jgi:hypothetical protein
MERRYYIERSRRFQRRRRKSIDCASDLVPDHSKSQEFLIKKV